MIEVSVYYPIGRKMDEPAADKVRIEFVLPKRPFLFWSDYHVAEKVQYPRGYGIAHYVQESDKLLFAPIPFNIIIGFLIWSYKWARAGFAYWCHKHGPKEATSENSSGGTSQRS